VLQAAMNGRSLLVSYIGAPGKGPQRAFDTL
jgi:hypothetical protein